MRAKLNNKKNYWTLPDTRDRFPVPDKVLLVLEPVSLDNLDESKSSHLITKPVYKKVYI